MVRVLVFVVPFGDNVIPVVLQLEDDTIIEPTDLYQLTIANFSNPRAVVVGDMSTSYIIVKDDDGKYHIWYFKGTLDVWYERNKLFINFQLPMVKGFYNACLVGVDSTHCTSCPVIGH